MKSIVQEKSFLFSVRIVNLCRYLGKKREFVISNQIMRSGTSIGANLAESEYAISKNDFINKLYIALKETNETIYWLRLLYKTDYISETQFISLYRDAEEIRKMLASSTRTIKREEM